MHKIDVSDFMTRCSAIYDLYELATIGLEHPSTAQKKVDSLVSLMQRVSEDKYFTDGKKPPNDFWETAIMKSSLMSGVKKRIEFAKQHIKNQIVVMYHSYIEYIMAKIVGMILEKEENIIRGIYNDREKGGFPFSINKILDNKDNIISFMINNEVERFIRKSMEDKITYIKKYFNIDFKWTDNTTFNSDIMEIDKIRHDIIHSGKEVLINDRKLLEIHDYIVGIGMHLILESRLKYKIDAGWTIADKNYIR